VVAVALLLDVRCKRESGEPGAVFDTATVEEQMQRRRRCRYSTIVAAAASNSSCLLLPVCCRALLPREVPLPAPATRTPHGHLLQLPQSRMQGKTVTVGYATSPGNASATGDYASTSGTLTFAPSETAKTVSVSVMGDTLVEGDETFDLVLSNPVNATLAGTSATARILNDDVRGGCGAEGRRNLPSWPPACAALALALAAAP
jgi:hypothetical protein